MCRKKTLLIMCCFMILTLLMAAGNRYVQAASWPDPAHVTLSGTVKLSGDRESRDIKAGQFQVKVTSESDELQLPDRILDVADGGSIALGSFTFTEAGTYRFKVQQIEGNSAGYTYDTAAVTATVQITYNSRTNKMENSISYRKSGQAVSGITFSNTYKEEKQEAPRKAMKEKTTEPVEELAAECSGDKETMKPGADTTFSVVFENTGDTVLEGIYIRQYVPEHMLFADCEESGSYGAIDGNEHATWFVKELQPGERVELWLKCRLYICLPDDAKIVSTGYYEVTGSQEEVLTNDPDDPAELLDIIEVKIDK